MGQVISAGWALLGEGDFPGCRRDVHGVFLVRFGCLFVSGNLTLKLWHDFRFLASRNVRGNALFARNYRVTKLVNARLSVKIVRKLTIYYALNFDEMEHLLEYLRTISTNRSVPPVSSNAKCKHNTADRCK